MTMNTKYHLEVTTQIHHVPVEIGYNGISHASIFGQFFDYFPTEVGTSYRKIIKSAYLSTDTNALEDFFDNSLSTSAPEITGDDATLTENCLPDDNSTAHKNSKTESEVMN